MTVVRKSQIELPGPSLGPAGRFPAMRPLDSAPLTFDLGEEEGLFIGYGSVRDPLPYTMQDQYDGPRGIQTFPTLELENRFLKAVLVPALGGRLWSLHDKAAGRELLLSNRDFRPNNLAIRNAWVAGGVEYNIGRHGHDEQTCSPRFAALLEDSDGTPVVRIYDFDRDRLAPFQLDFYLPEDSRFLLLRARVENVSDSLLPMYWWSNLALPMRPGQRVVAPAAEAYAHIYRDGAQPFSKIPLPDAGDFDCTFPENIPSAKDYYYDIPDSSRKFEAVVEPDGTGFLYASTRRLQGRKLFVWGNGRGGRNWQRKLVSEGLPDYLEIQGGLAKTQLECLPMPPRTAWEWLEAYGPFQMNDSKAAFGEWSRACEAVAGQVDAILPEPWLDAELLRTRGTFAKRPGRLVSAGSGWGALEELRRGAKFCAHLDFGQPQEEQRPWRKLLQTGSLPDVPPDSYVVQPEWDRLLQAARVQTWQTWFHRGLYAFHQGNLALAERRFRKSAKLCKTAWNLFALANCARLHGERRKTIRLMAQAMRLPEADLSLAKECLRVLMEQDVAPAMILELLDAQPAEHQKRPIFRFFRAWALAGAGRLDEAEELVCADGGLEVPDIREGEASITDLYISIRKKQAARAGKNLEDQTIEVPGRLDLRMS